MFDLDAHSIAENRSPDTAKYTIAGKTEATRCQKSYNYNEDRGLVFLTSMVGTNHWPCSNHVTKVEILTGAPKKAFCDSFCFVSKVIFFYFQKILFHRSGSSGSSGSSSSSIWRKLKIDNFDLDLLSRLMRLGQKSQDGKNDSDHSRPRTNLTAELSPLGSWHFNLLSRTATPSTIFFQLKKGLSSKSFNRMETGRCVWVRERERKQ